jgi:hypothetical protein
MNRAAMLCALAACVCAPSLAARAETFDYEQYFKDVPEGQPASDKLLDAPAAVKEKVLIVGDAGRAAFFREVVRITFQTPRGPALCSGVAVASDRVLTAGHCGCENPDTYVVAASNERFTNADASLTRHVLSRPPVLYHGYDCSNAGLPQPGRDASILYLATPIDGLKIAPAAAMFPVANDTKSQIIIAGYGRTLEGAFPAGLLAARTSVVDHFCALGQVGSSLCAPFREFVLSSLVTSIAAGVDTCDGDSGGPVYWIFPGRDAEGETRLRRFLIGITSRGLNGVPQFGASGCGGGGIYTTVGSVELLGWLAANGAPLEVGTGARHFALEEVANKSADSSPKK